MSNTTQIKKISQYDGYRTTAFFGFNIPKSPKQRSHFHIPESRYRYTPLRRSKSMEEMFCSFTEMNESKDTKIQQIKRRLYLKSGLQAQMNDDKASGDNSQLATALKFEENEIITPRGFVKLHKQTQTDACEEFEVTKSQIELSELIDEMDEASQLVCSTPKFEAHNASTENLKEMISSAMFLDKDHDDGISSDGENKRPASTTSESSNSNMKRRQIFIAENIHKTSLTPKITEKALKEELSATEDQLFENNSEKDVSSEVEIVACEESDEESIDEMNETTQLVCTTPEFEALNEETSFESQKNEETIVEKEANDDSLDFNTSKKMAELLSMLVNLDSAEEKSFDTENTLKEELSATEDQLFENNSEKDVSSEAEIVDGEEYEETKSELESFDEMDETPQLVCTTSEFEELNASIENLKDIVSDLFLDCEESEETKLQIKVSELESMDETPQLVSKNHEFEAFNASTENLEEMNSSAMFLDCEETKLYNEVSELQSMDETFQLVSTTPEFEALNASTENLVEMNSSAMFLDCEETKLFNEVSELQSMDETFQLVSTTPEFEALNASTENLVEMNSSAMFLSNEDHDDNISSDGDNKRPASTTSESSDSNRSLIAENIQKASSTPEITEEALKEELSATEDQLFENNSEKDVSSEAEIVDGEESEETKSQIEVSELYSIDEMEGAWNTSTKNLEEMNSSAMLVKEDHDDSISAFLKEELLAIEDQLFDNNSEKDVSSEVEIVACKESDEESFDEMDGTTQLVCTTPQLVCTTPEFEALNASIENLEEMISSAMFFVNEDHDDNISSDGENKRPASTTSESSNSNLKKRRNFIAENIQKASLTPKKAEKAAIISEHTQKASTIPKIANKSAIFCTVNPFADCLTPEELKKKNQSSTLMNWKHEVEEAKRAKLKISTTKKMKISPLKVASKIPKVAFKRKYSKLKETEKFLDEVTDKLVQHCDNQDEMNERMSGALQKMNAEIVTIDEMQEEITTQRDTFSEAMSEILAEEISRITGSSNLHESDD